MQHRGLDVAQARQLADLVGRGEVRRVVALVVPDHEHAARALRLPHDAFRLRAAEPQRLLDEDVAPGRERSGRLRAVRAGAEHEHGLDARIAQQSTGVGRDDRCRVPACHRVERPAIHFRQADQLEQVRPLGQRRQVHHLRDPAAADDADAQPPHRPTLSRR